ncbi:ATP-binding protein [Ensifer sp. ENS05]|uniref:ATP-binding protein n=1 Tax=Ensifer sp. ENS05 TaxID=2769277 RepID=UPI00177B6699|nr:ATP-binding protein [Ensifer sp. ENS05]MBD9597391.1 ATP-binding protein [Ensifer sp. ENS05]
MSDDNRKRAIGKVISVAADRFVVEMHPGTDNFTVVGFDDVHYVARLGSFLMIPTQSEYIVVEVVGLRERDASSPSDRNDFDRAGASKYLDVVPVGMLPTRGGGFRFGVSLFPSLYADVLYALDGELDRIFETQAAIEPSVGMGVGPCQPENATRYRVLPIGKSVVFEGYDVKVRLDEFFGGHVAVLGNTGSGKSCTVAAILQSLFGKADEHYARGATFIVFDVNGEYHSALKDLANKEGAIGVEHVVLNGTTSGFRLPHWFLDLAEWELLLQASERTQVPILRMALGLSTLFSSKSTAELVSIRNHILAKCISQILRDDSSSPSKHDRIIGILQRFNTDAINAGTIRPFVRINYGQLADSEGLSDYLTGDDGFELEDLKMPDYRNLPFDFAALGEAIDLAILYSEAYGNRQIRDYCSQMVTRFQALQDRKEYEFLRHERGDIAGSSGESEFLATLVGLVVRDEQHIKAKQIIVIDMNDVDDEVVELVSSVIARMLFRLLRRAEPRNRFPIHLLLEEAHRYISATPSRYAIDATKIFERIAKEGRKYGMFVMLASQRPSELSKTVLSQCSNFLVHRIQNPDDLSQIRQMTPFISDMVLKRLPSLPRQHALVFGTSVNLPTTFKVRQAAPRPRSDDTKVVDLWFHEEGRAVEIRLNAPTAGEPDYDGEAEVDDLLHDTI